MTWKRPQAYHTFHMVEMLYRQHCSQKKMHVLIQLQNSNWLREKNINFNLILTSIKLTLYTLINLSKIK